MSVFPDRWLLLNCGPYEVLQGETDALVRTKASPQGYLWQYRKRYGFSPTIEEAKARVEGLVVHYGIPTAQRWMSGL